MKKLLIILPLLFIGVFAIAQNESKKAKTDTTKIKVGDGEIIFVGYESEKCDTTKESWTTLAVDFGMSGYMAPDFNMSLPSEQGLMELDYPRSNSLAISTMLSKAEIIKDKLYISPGIGIAWNNYHFKNNINIATDNDTTLFSRDSVTEYDKYKLRTTYLQIPLLVGVRIGKSKYPLGIQIGVIGSYKIGSAVKQKYEMNDARYRKKIKDDYNINPFKLDALARVSIGDVGIFAKYSLSPLFEKNKAPELYPFSVGFTFGGFMKQMEKQKHKKPMN